MHGWVVNAELENAEPKSQEWRLDLPSPPVSQWEYWKCEIRKCRIITNARVKKCPQPIGLLTTDRRYWSYNVYNKSTTNQSKWNFDHTEREGESIVCLVACLSL